MLIESSQVKSKINSWIDLIFGYKQDKEAGIKAMNIFQKFSYQDPKSKYSITKDSCAKLDMAYQFGHVPKKIFYSAHLEYNQFKKSSPFFSSLKRLHQLNM